MMLASASILLILFGWMDVAVAAADTTWHQPETAQSGGPGDRDEHCRYGWFHDHHSDGHCCTRRPPMATPRPAPTATPAPLPASRPTSSPATSVVPPAPGSSSPAHASTPSPSPSGDPSAQTRPPVIAPPALTVPPVGGLTVIRSNTGAIDVVAVSTVLVVSTIAVLSLALIRRSG
jgi:hypothetical protein